MNLNRIYEYRFKDVKPELKNKVWKVIANFIYKKLDEPISVLDPAGGMCEFINNVPCKKKTTIDLNESFIKKHADSDVDIIIGNCLKVDLHNETFNGVFVSNFLEHLNSAEEASDFLNKMYNSLKPGGQIAIIGPNFKYAYKKYFDISDHKLILTHLSLLELLHEAKFEIKYCFPRFLPFSFSSNLPIKGWLVFLYLKMPFVWFVFGEQFLIIAKKSKN